MAVVTPANLAPDTLPRVRGAFLVYQHRGQWVAMKWPRKRGPATNPNVIWTSKMFGYAGKMAANPEPMSYETARFSVEGSHWLPRDALTMAAYGKFYEVVLPDGSIAPQAYHGPPVEPNYERLPVQAWQPNQLQGVIVTANSTSAYAFKGAAFTPDVNMTLTAVNVCLTPVNGGQYRAVLAALNGSNIITTITLGVQRTIAGTTKKFYEFQLAGSMVAGTRYAILVGRNGGGNTYALPMVGGTDTNFLIPCTNQQYARLAQQSPAIGQLVEVGTTAFPMSLLLDF